MNLTVVYRGNQRIKSRVGLGTGRRTMIKVGRDHLIFYRDPFPEPVALTPLPPY